MHKATRAKEREAEREDQTEKEEITWEANILIEKMDKEIQSERRNEIGPVEAAVTTEQMMEGREVRRRTNGRWRLDGRAIHKGMSSTAAVAVGETGGGAIWSEEWQGDAGTE